MSTSDIIQIVTLIVAIAAVIVTMVYTQKSIQASIALTQDQIRAQMFSEYTRRYNEIILNMPSESSDGTNEPSADAMKYLRLYFDLCSEEYHLWKRGMIEAEVWEMWEEGMQNAMKSPLYSKAWEKLRGEYNGDFRGFFQDEVIDWEEDANVASNKKKKK